MRTEMRTDAVIRYGPDYVSDVLKDREGPANVAMAVRRMFWTSDIFLRHISEKLYINELLAGYDRSAYSIGFRISFYT